MDESNRIKFVRRLEHFFSGNQCLTFLIVNHWATTNGRQGCGATVLLFSYYHKRNSVRIPLPSRQVSGKINTIMYGSTKPEDDILGRGFRRNFCSEKRLKSALLVPY